MSYFYEYIGKTAVLPWYQYFITVNGVILLSNHFKLIGKLYWGIFLTARLWTLIVCESPVSALIYFPFHFSLFVFCHIFPQVNILIRCQDCRILCIVVGWFKFIPRIICPILLSTTFHKWCTMFNLSPGGSNIIRN